MKLPSYDCAVVDVVKVAGYCLNAGHEEGRHKARVFSAALGLCRSDAEWLRDRFLEGIVKFEAVEQVSSPYGRRFVVDMEICRGRRCAIIRTAWMLRHGEHCPRLVSCFVL